MATLLFHVQGLLLCLLLWTIFSFRVQNEQGNYMKVVRLGVGNGYHVMYRQYDGKIFFKISLQVGTHALQ